MEEVRGRLELRRHGVKARRLPYSTDLHDHLLVWDREERRKLPCVARRVDLAQVPDAGRDADVDHVDKRIAGIERRHGGRD